MSVNQPMKPNKPKMLKANNRQMVLDLFRNQDTLSIPRISDITALSKTTVGKIVEHFFKEGAVISAGKGASTDEGGKKPDLFQLNSVLGLAVGIQVHHLALYAVLTDLKANILHSVVMPMDNDEGLETVLQKIHTAFDRLFSESGHPPERLVGMALGFPAITNFRNGIIRTSPWFPSWGEEVLFQQSLIKELDVGAPVFIDNECRFQVLAEKKCGVAQNRKNIIAVYIRAGIVAGIMVNNEIKRGVHYLAGEIGHMVINPIGDDICNCGSRGCFEAMVYEHRLLKKAKLAAPKYPSSKIFEHNPPERIIIEDIFDAANKKDELAKQLIDEIIGWFAIAFSNLIMMVDPEIIVIQGIYAKAGDYFLENLRQQVNSCVLPKIKKDVDIAYTHFGPEVSPLGAALFVISDYFSKKQM